MAKGDHIAVKRRGGLYRHHGIDLGDGNVIHFSGEPLNNKTPIVEKVTMEHFLKDGELEIVRYSDSWDVFPPDEIIARAETKLGEGNYNLVRNNCEHFATWCRCGKAHSTQITKLAIASTLVVAGLVGVFVAHQMLSDSDDEDIDSYEA